MVDGRLYGSCLFIRCCNSGVELTPYSFTRQWYFKTQVRLSLSYKGFSRKLYTYFLMPGQLHFGFPWLHELVYFFPRPLLFSSFVSILVFDLSLDLRSTIPTYWYFFFSRFVFSKVFPRQIFRTRWSWLAWLTWWRRSSPSPSSKRRAEENSFSSLALSLLSSTCYSPLV